MSKDGEVRGGGGVNAVVMNSSFSAAKCSSGNRVAARSSGSGVGVSIEDMMRQDFFPSASSGVWKINQVSLNDLLPTDPPAYHRTRQDHRHEQEGHRLQ